MAILVQTTSFMDRNFTTSQQKDGTRFGALVGAK
jgi:hypothetical protein